MCTIMYICSLAMTKYRQPVDVLTKVLNLKWLPSNIFVKYYWMFYCPLQKARLARIRIAKASSGAAFVSKKKAAEARLAAQESGLEMDESYREEDIFELQHHHLLRCLEKTTVSMTNEFMSRCCVNTTAISVMNLFMSSWLLHL